MGGLKNSYLHMVGWGLLLAGALSFGSCSNDETLQTIEPKAIAFGYVSIKENSRAIQDPSYGTENPIDEFKVWGTVTGNVGSANLYNGALVERKGAADGQPFTCTQEEYWIPNATYNFRAIANATAVSPEIGLPTSISYTADGVSDLLLAEQVTVATNESAVPTTGVNTNLCVPFTFSHLLSKVHFTFISTSSLKPITVTDIQITGHYASGTYTIANATPWGSQVKAESTQPLSFGNAEGTVTTTGVTSQLARLIIPGNSQSLTISFKQDGESIEPVTLTHDFAPNTQYNIQITIEGGSEITFEIVELEAWGAEQDIPLNP